MDDHKRKAGAQWILSGGLLLAGVVIFVSVFAVGAWAHALPVVAAMLVVASAATAINAVASGSRSMNRDKRTVLLFSSGALALGPAIAINYAGLQIAMGSPICVEANGGSSEGCIALYVVISILISGLLALAVITAVVGAVITGLINAAQRHERNWFMAILIALVGAIAVVIWDPLALSHPQWEGYSPLLDVQGWLIPLAPLLVSLLTLLYSLLDAQ